jgi:hypothetical protein
LPDNRTLRSIAAANHRMIDAIAVQMRGPDSAHYRVIDTVADNRALSTDACGFRPP